MPIIPSDRSLISTDVPGASVNPSSFGAVGQSLAKLGNAIQDTSLDMLTEVKRSEAVEHASKALFDDRYASEDMVHQLKIQYPDGYVKKDDGSNATNPDGTPRTITQEFRDWANDRFEKTQTSMPSKLAQEIYAQHAGAYYSDKLVSVRNDELIQRVQSFKRDQESQLKFGLDRLVSTPTVKGAYDLMDNMVLRVNNQKGKLISSQEAFQNEQGIKKEVAQSLFDGMINTALMEPKNGETRKARINEALAVLDGKDPDSARRSKNQLYTIADTMDPDQKADFKRRLITLSQIADKVDLSDLRKDTQNAISRLELGEQVPIQPYINGWGKALAENHVSPLDYAEAIGTMVAHDEAIKVFKSPAFLMASPEDKASMISTVNEKANAAFRSRVPPEVFKQFPSVGGQVMQQINNQISAIAKKADDMAHSDFVKFAQFNPSVAAYTKGLDFSNPQTLHKTGSLLQKRNKAVDSLGDSYFGGKSSDFRLISKEESQNLSNFLKDDTHSYGEASDGLVALYRSDPKHYGSIVDQMIRDKNLGGEWRIALVHPNRVLMSEVIRTIRDGSTIRADAEKVINAKGDRVSDFDNAVQKYAGGYLMGLTQQNQDSAVAETERTQIRAVVTTKAMDLYRQEGGAKSVDEYARMATESFLGTRYKNISVGGFLAPGARGVMNIPSEIEGRPLTDSEVNNVEINRNLIFRSNDSLKALGVVPPAGMSDIDQSKFYDQVRETGRMVLKGDNSGYYIQYKNREINSYVRVMGKKGRTPIPVTVPLSKMIHEPPKSERPEPSKKGFMEKLIEGFTSTVQGNF